MEMFGSPPRQPNALRRHSGILVRGTKRIIIGAILILVGLGVLPSWVQGALVLLGAGGVSGILGIRVRRLMREVAA